MFWHPSHYASAEKVGHTRDRAGITYVIVEHRASLGGFDDFLVLKSKVREVRRPADMIRQYTGPGAHAYCWMDSLGVAETRFNPNYSAVPSTPTSAFGALAIATPPPPPAVPGSQSSGGPFLGYSMLEYLAGQTVACGHEETADTGMGVAYCKLCPAKLKFINMEWQVV